MITLWGLSQKPVFLYKLFLETLSQRSFENMWNQKITIFYAHLSIFEENKNSPFLIHRMGLFPFLDIKKPKSLKAE